MLKYTVLLIVGLAAALFAVPGAAQDQGLSLQTESASASDGFSLESWAVGNSSNVDDWWDESLAGQASGQTYAFTDVGAERPSLMLAGGLDDDPFVEDGRFHDGTMYTDRFITINDNGYVTHKNAYKALRLSNGDVLLVALVPAIGSLVEPTPGSGHNIGMARYSATGVRRKWPNAAAAFTDVSRDFYVFPNKTMYDSQGSFTSINDVKEYDGWIYVLASRYRSSTNRNTNVRLVRFQLSSSRYKGGHVFVDEVQSDSGVGMYFHTDGGLNKLTVAVNRKTASSQPSQHQTWMKRYIVSDLSTLTVDSNFGTNGIRNVSPAGCNTCKPLVFAGSESNEGGTYIAGNHTPSTTSQYGYVTRYDIDGIEVAAFGTSGTRSFQFPSPLSPQTRYDKLTDMVVDKEWTMVGFSDRIYALAAVNDRCSTTSVGVIKLNLVGASVSSFGTNGILMFGGGGSASCLDTISASPAAMALNGSRLAIAGYSTRHHNLVIIGYPHDVGGLSFSIVDKDIGYVSDDRVLTPSGIDIGDNGGGSTFVSVVPSESDSFYAVARALDSRNNKKRATITARIRADRIFGDGLE